MTVKDLLRIDQVLGEDDQKHIYFNLHFYLFIGRSIVCLRVNGEDVYYKEIEEVLND